jgi:hypothetical protein
MDEIGFSVRLLATHNDVGLIEDELSLRVAEINRAVLTRVTSAPRYKLGASYAAYTPASLAGWGTWRFSEIAKSEGAGRS